MTMPVMAANHTNGEPGYGRHDGVLGLDWAIADADITDSNYTQPSFFEVIREKLDQPLFTVEVHTADNSKGTLNFGFVDESKYTGNLSKVPVEPSKTNWIVDGISFGANGKNISSKLTQTNFDTGGLGFATEDVQAVASYWADVTGASQQTDGIWVYPCTTVPPDFTFDFENGVSSSISGAVMNPNHYIVPNNETYCYGGVQAEPGSGSTNAGDQFFVTNFMVFNFEEPSISFAPYDLQSSLITWSDPLCIHTEAQTCEVDFAIP